LLKPETSSVAGAFVPDARIQAAVIAAPGLAFTFAPDRLNNVSVPVQLWSADQDTNVPYASNTRLVREALGPRAEFHPVPGAGHFSFLAPCGLLRPPGVCADPGNFDRKAFHASMNASAVAFFDAHLNGRTR
jgi:predicted dienelactone hydrolase